MQVGNQSRFLEGESVRVSGGTHVIWHDFGRAGLGEGRSRNARCKLVVIKSKLM